MNNGLSQHEAGLLDGQESFCGPGVTQPLLLIDYWRWQGSVLLDNTSRGILAEFLVAAALDLHRKPRREWDESDEWDFYVLSTKVLDQKCPEQKTIRLSSLEKLSPRKCCYADLKETISDVESEIRNVLLIPEAETI